MDFNGYVWYMLNEWMDYCVYYNIKKLETVKRNKENTGNSLVSVKNDSSEAVGKWKYCHQVSLQD